MKELEQLQNKIAELERRREKSQAKVKRIKRDIARLNKEERARRTKRLIEIGAECEKIVPGLGREDITKDEIRALLEQAFASEK